MATINEQFIQVKTKANFESRLSAGDVKDTSIAFIEDTNEIWAKGHYYPCPCSATEITNLLNNKVDKESGKSLVADELITKLTGLDDQNTIDAAINAVQGNLTTHINDKDNPHEVTKAQIGLSNVDNTSDVNKPISTATQTALNNKVDKTTTVNGHALSGNVTVTKDDVGLGNVDNTSDANKPVSTAQQAAINSAKSAIDAYTVNGKTISTNPTVNAEDIPITDTLGYFDSSNVEGALQETKQPLDTHLQNNTPGLKHIPSGGAANQILAWSANGTAKWENLSNIEASTEDMLAYGVEWDITVSNPAITRIGNPLLHKSLPIQSAYRGCVAQGAEIKYYLDPNDWSKKEDGTASVLDGTDGTVRVHTPKFYGKSGSNGNKRWVKISTTQIDSSWVEVPEMLVDAYGSTLKNAVPVEDAGFTEGLPQNSLVSVVNTTAGYRGGNNRSANDAYLETDQFRTDLGKPKTTMTRANARTYARNAGAELLSYEQFKWVFYWAYVIEYANFNSQAAYNQDLTSDGYRQGGLGTGMTDWNGTDWTSYNGNFPLTPCGYCNEFGNFTGVKDLVIPETTVSESTTVPTKTFKVPRWRGFDNPFGDVWVNLDGIVIVRASSKEIPTAFIINDPEKYTDGVEEAKANYNKALEIHNASGYIKSLSLGETAEMIPESIGGNTTTYMCDYYWCPPGDSSGYTLLVGGCAVSYGAYAGLGAFYGIDSVSSSYGTVGFRTVNVIK